MSSGVPAMVAAGGNGIVARTVLVFAVVAAGAVAYLTMRPQPLWLLPVLGVVAAAITDGTVRSHPRWTDTRLLASLPYVFLPVVVVVGAVVFLDEAVDGFPRALAGLAAGAVAAVVVAGEYHTVDIESRLYGQLRVTLAVVTYLAAFATFAVISDSGQPVPLQAFLVGIVSIALAVELLRESHLVDASTPLVALAVGITLGELRLALFFFPMDDLLVGALLVIGFYFATGLVHHLLDRDLSLVVAAEYALVAGAGAAAVVLSRMAE